MSQTYIGIPQPEYDFWRESGTVGGALPTGVNDTTKQIQRIGSIVLGGTDFSNIVTGVVSAVATNIYLSLATNSAGRGQILYGNSPLSYLFTRNLPTVVNDYIDIMSLAVNNPAFNFRLSVTANTSNVNTSKSYLVTVNSNLTAGAWRVLSPISNSGPNAVAGGQDFEVLIMVDTVNAFLRIRRTVGTSSAPCNIRIESVSSNFVTATELSTSGTDATVYTVLSTFSAPRDFFRSGTGTTEPDGLNDTTEAIARTGGVMIGASNPTTIAAALDVTGAVVNRVVSLTNIASSGAIGTAAATVDVASYINLNQTTANINVTLPTPTNSTAGRLLILANTGTTLFTVNTTIYVGPQTSREFVWNGSAWYPLTNNPNAIITDWSYKNTSAPSASAGAWKGNRFTPDRDVILYSICFYGSAIANATYQAAVITGTASPGNVATAIKSLPYTVVASPATLTGNYIWLDFAFPVLLTTGVQYGLMVGRTDSTDTYVLPVTFNGGTVASTAVPMTGLSHGNAWIVPSASLALGTAITVVSVDSISAGYRFKYPTSPF